LYHDSLGRNSFETRIEGTVKVLDAKVTLMEGRLRFAEEVPRVVPYPLCLLWGVCVLLRPGLVAFTEGGGGVSDVSVLAHRRRRASPVLAAMASQL